MTTKSKTLSPKAAPKAAPVVALPTPKAPVAYCGFKSEELPRHIQAGPGTLRVLAQAVLVVGRPYRMGANHTHAWGEKALQMAAKGTTGAALAQAGVPAHMVGYMVRRGYLLAKPAKA
ncbi:MAG: hypothetical protein ABL993_08245 [Vicinamibacterales bacterium]